MESRREIVLKRVDDALRRGPAIDIVSEADDKHSLRWICGSIVDDAGKEVPDEIFTAVNVTESIDADAVGYPRLSWRNDGFLTTMLTAGQE